MWLFAPRAPRAPQQLPSTTASLYMKALLSLTVRSQAPINSPGLTLGLQLFLRPQPPLSYVKASNHRPYPVCPLTYDVPPRWVYYLMTITSRKKGDPPAFLLTGLDGWPHRPPGTLSWPPHLKQDTCDRIICRRHISFIRYKELEDHNKVTKTGQVDI